MEMRWRYVCFVPLLLAGGREAFLSPRAPTLGRVRSLSTSGPNQGKKCPPDSVSRVKQLDGSSSRQSSFLHLKNVAADEDEKTPIEKSFTFQRPMKIQVIEIRLATSTNRRWRVGGGPHSQARCASLMLLLRSIIEDQVYLWHLCLHPPHAGGDACFGWACVIRWITACRRQSLFPAC